MPRLIYDNRVSYNRTHDAKNGSVSRATVWANWPNDQLFCPDQVVSLPMLYLSNAMQKFSSELPH